MSQLASDDFERANNTDLGANWTPNPNDGGSLQIVSGEVTDNVNNDASEIYNAVSWPDDQYSEITFGAAGGGGGVGAGVGPTCREITSAKTYYRLIGSAAGYELGKFTTGTFSSLSSGSGTTFGIGDSLRLEVTGGATTTLKMFKNGVQFGGDVTDSSSPLTTGSAGLAYSSSDSATIETWAGGDFGGGAAYNAVPLLKYYQSLKRGGIFH